MSVKAKSVMQTQVVTVSPDDRLDTVRGLFLDEQINGAPVVDEDATLLGVISTSDLLYAADDEHTATRGDPSWFRELFESAGPDFEDAPEGFIDRLAERTVRNYMTESVVTVPPDASVSAVARALRENRIHRVLVADAGRLVGIISSFDLVALLETE
jgi:CBS domain-containing protein